MLVDAQELVTRYVAVWHEPDAGLRRAAIERLWAEDGAHVLHPPQEIRESAAKLGFPAPTLRATGYDEIELRVGTSYQDFVVDQKFSFRRRDDAVRLDDVVRFTWEAVVDGEVVGGGEELLVLDGDGRIRTDYMFPGS